MFQIKTEPLTVSQWFYDICNRVVKLWRENLSKVNQKAAESLADRSFSSFIRLEFLWHLFDSQKRSHSEGNRLRHRRPRAKNGPRAVHVIPREEFSESDTASRKHPASQRVAL